MVLGLAPSDPSSRKGPTLSEGKSCKVVGNYTSNSNQMAPFSLAPLVSFMDQGHRGKHLGMSIMWNPGLRSEWCCNILFPPDIIELLVGEAKQQRVAPRPLFSERLLRNITFDESSMLSKKEELIDAGKDHTIKEKVKLVVLAPDSLPIIPIDREKGSHSTEKNKEPQEQRYSIARNRLRRKIQPPQNFGYTDGRGVKGEEPFFERVAQVLFTLPYSFSNLGMLSGILLQIIYGLIGSRTTYLISVLYIEYRRRKEKVNVSYKNHVIQITGHLSIELLILGVVWIGNRSDHWHMHLDIGLLVGLNMGRIS
ncbi:hypothetical protein RJ639_044541 [Escallonia herrerae]|uniref:Amino acid transporter transmembrane domain-containing protein n=1 Tax=Escallonia herrerae TaxID=1293975 RepID=A0AA88WB20_9ASTE|nr:hypothetical protein RJ639_044541 [Escallonia herrerae]